jgi:hypothetical protein
MMEDKVRELLREVAEEAPAQPAIPPGLQARARRRMGLALAAKLLTVAEVVVGATFGVRSLTAAPGPLPVGTPRRRRKAPRGPCQCDPDAVPDALCGGHRRCMRPAVMLPVVDEEIFGDTGNVHADSVDVPECRNGHAKGLATVTVQESQEVGGGTYEDAAEFFLKDVGGEWTVLAYGTGIGCFPPYAPAELQDTCEALGLG